MDKDKESTVPPNLGDRVKRRESDPESLAEEEKAKKKLKKSIKEKLLEVLKLVHMDEYFSIALREKQKKGYVLDYPDRTICGCDGEVYNMLMNWVYKNQIASHLAFDRFVETFGKDLEKIKQRPESADSASRRYMKRQRNGGPSPSSQLSLFKDVSLDTLKVNIEKDSK